MQVHHLSNPVCKTRHPHLTFPGDIDTRDLERKEPTQYCTVEKEQVTFSLRLSTQHQNSWGHCGGKGSRDRYHPSRSQESRQAGLISPCPNPRTHSLGQHPLTHSPKKPTTAQYNSRGMLYGVAFFLWRCLHALATG